MYLMTSAVWRVHAFHDISIAKVYMISPMRSYMYFVTLMGRVHAFCDIHGEGACFL